MAKTLTRLTYPGLPDEEGTILRIGDNDSGFANYLATDLRPPEYSTDGNRVTIERERDGANLLTAVHYSQIFNANTGLFFASGPELQVYLLGFEIGTGGGVIVTPPAPHFLLNYTTVLNYNTSLF